MQIVQEALSRVARYSHLNAFIEVFGEEVLTRAEEIDRKISQGIAGSLAGCTIAVKDNISMKGKKTTCASRMLENFVSLYDATVIRKLLDADAILLGRTNMDEFAMGSSNENSVFGVARNPYDESRVPGGSSGGSAISVATGITSAAIGSDTGGSIRQPAAFTGTVGLKPTYGRISRYGLVAYASSCDQIGTITNSVEDAASLLKVTAGYDEHDTTSKAVSLEDFNQYLRQGVCGLRIGVASEYISDSLDLEMKEVFEQSLDILREGGAEIKKISLPHTKYTVPAYYILATAEASSNLARYDGIRYGYRASELLSINEMYSTSRTEGFGAEVKRRIMLGTYVLSAGYAEEYYAKAQKIRRLVRNDFLDAYDNVDAILTLTTPTTAFKKGEKIEAPLMMYLSDLYTVSANLAGIPAMSIPAGKDRNGLPIGIQILAKHFCEADIFKVGSYLETGLKKRTNGKIQTSDNE